MRRLATLGISVPEGPGPKLATRLFRAMRCGAEPRSHPERTHAIWQNTPVLSSGKSGQWSDILDEKGVRRTTGA